MDETSAGVHRPEDERSEGRISLGQLAATVVVILNLNADEIAQLPDKFSPALCELIFKTQKRELLREKLTDLHVGAAAATQSGWIKNANEIIRDADEQLRRLIKGEEPDGE